MEDEGSTPESMESYSPALSESSEITQETTSSYTVSLTTLRAAYILTSAALVGQHSRTDELKNVLRSLRHYIAKAESSSSHQVSIEESTYLATLVEYRSSLSVRTHISEIVKSLLDSMEPDELGRSGTTSKR